MKLVNFFKFLKFSTLVNDMSECVILPFLLTAVASIINNPAPELARFNK